MTPLPSPFRLHGAGLHSSTCTISKPTVLTSATHTADPLYIFLGMLRPIGVSEPDAETVPRSSVPFIPCKGSTITLTFAQRVRGQAMIPLYIALYASTSFTPKLLCSVPIHGVHLYLRRYTGSGLSLSYFLSVSMDRP